MEVFEIKNRSLRRQPSTAPAPRGNRVPYIIAFVVIILVTSATLLIFHSILGYKNLTERTISLQRSKAEKLQNFECEERLCNSKECVSIASRILQLMNPNTDPCIDFYEYSCGGYAKHIDIPRGHKIYTPREETKSNILYSIKNLMETSSSRNESQTTKKLKEFYRSCMDSDERDLHQKLSLERWFSEIGLTVDGFNSEEETGLSTDRSWKALLSRLEEYQIHTVVKPTFKSSKRNPIEKIEIDCIVPFFDYKVYLNDTDYSNLYLLTQYKSYIMDALNLLPIRNTTKIENFVEDVLQIETTIATSINNAGAPLSSMISSEYIWLLKDLWRNIIGDAIQEMKILSICKYDLNSILSTLNDAEPEKVTNYIVWRMLNEIIPYLGTDYRKLYRHHVSELPASETVFESKWQECSDLLQKDLGIATFKALLDSGNLDVRKIQQTKDAFLEVKRNFLFAFQSIEWAKGIIKKLFLDKVQNMKINLGIPDSITQPNILDSVFNDLEIEDNFLLTVMNLKKFKTRHFFTKLWHGNFDNASSIISLEDNPFGGTSRYDYNTNTVHLDIGLLYPPLFYYSKNIPKYLQFGEYALLVREMAHAFDSTGSFYDGRGRKWDKIFWPQIMEEKHNFYLGCLQNQTEILRISSNNESSEFLNTIIVDIGSFLVLYEGLIDHLETWKNEKQIPGLNMTKEQLYYVRIAQRYCEQRKFSLRFDEKINLSSKIRVNTAVSNTKFGEVFGCPLNSILNPELKCNLQ